MCSIAEHLTVGCQIEDPHHEGKLLSTEVKSVMITGKYLLFWIKFSFYEKAAIFLSYFPIDLPFSK